MDRQRVGAVGLAMVALAGAGYWTALRLEKPSPVSYSTLSALPGAEAGKIVVHVVGAVKKPGLYSLPEQARVNDAIVMAGGATSEADLSQVNLAARATDGSQVIVPKVGQRAPISAPAAASVGSSVSSPTRSSSSRGRKQLPAPSSIAINSADSATLQQLPGVGPSTAQKILDYRSQNGGFKSVDELLNVKGIGPKKLEAMRPYVTL